MAVPKSNKRYAVLLVILLAVLVALIGIYYVLARPLQPVGTVKPKGYAHIFSIYGVEADRLYRPTEVAVDNSGNIYIVDTYKHRVLIFDRDGKFIDQFGKKGSGKGEFLFPGGITVDDNGRIYVLSNKQNKVSIFNRNKQLVWEIEIPRPLTATVKNKKLYITTDRGIMVGDLNGNLLFSFGVKGRSKGQFNRPTGVAVDDKGNIYVADSMNYRLSAYNKEGKHLWDVGSPPDPKKAIQSRERRFGLPVGLTLSNDGLLYMMDAFNGEIYIYNTDGRQRGVVGEWGKEDGQFYYPGGLAAMGNELFAVADKFNNRVQVVRIPSPNVTPVVRAGRYIPWFLAILLLPLLLYMRRRKFVFAADEAFLRRAIRDGNITALAKAGKIYVIEDVYERLKEQAPGDVKLSKTLQVIEHLDEDRQKLASARGLSDEAAGLLSARFKRAKVTLLTDNDLLKKAAAEHKVVIVGYGEFVNGLGKQGVAG